MNLPLVMLGVISLLSQQVTENLFGPWVHGELMKLVAMGVAVGLAFAAWVLEIPDFAGLAPEKVAVLGVITGFLSYVDHALLEKIAPGNSAVPIAGILGKLTLRTSVQPPPPPPPEAPHG